MKTIKLTKSQVTIKEKKDLTYGNIEDIQEAMLGAVNVSPQGGMEGIKPEGLRSANRKLAQMMITKIEEDEKEKSYSDDWLSNLPAQDGQDLIEEINAETKDVIKKKVK